MAPTDTKIFRSSEVKFIAGVAKTNQFPKLFKPQIAFVGKSNVGKSSLINSLCGRKQLARTSKTPGRTRQINFFEVERKFILVDLPGYGFASVSGQMQMEWQRLILKYFTDNPHLRVVNLLIDARRGIKAHDTEVLKLVAEYGHKVQVIITKVDKEKNHQKIQAEISLQLEQLGLAECPIVLTSSEKRFGISHLQKNLLSLV